MGKIVMMEGRGPMEGPTDPVQRKQVRSKSACMTRYAAKDAWRMRSDGGNEEGPAKHVYRLFSDEKRGYICIHLYIHILLEQLPL